MDESRDKYFSDAEKCRGIGRLFSARLNDSKISKETVADYISSIDGRAKATNVLYVNQLVGEGPRVQDISPYAGTDQGRGRRRPIHLERLANAYDLLGVKKDDELISLTREVNELFTYPPAKRNTGEEIDLNALENLLTPEQMGSLTSLANHYLSLQKKK